MKKTLLFALVCLYALFKPYVVSAQTIGGGSMTTFAGVPTGSCLAPQQAVNSSTGDTYSCNGGTWLKIGPGSATGPVGPAGGDLSGSTYPNPVVAIGAITDAKTSLLNKPAVSLIANSNISLSGVQTIDGVAGTGNLTLVLAVAQSTASQNGPWVMQSSTWTRPTWYPSGGTTQAAQFSTTLVRLGSIYRGSVWHLTTAGPITIDTTATTWAQIIPAIVQSAATTFSALPSCASGTEGSSAAITDSTVTGLGATIAGGGSNHVQAYCNGSIWVVGAGAVASYSGFVSGSDYLLTGSKYGQIITDGSWTNGSSTLNSASMAQWDSTIVGQGVFATTNCRTGGRGCSFRHGHYRSRCSRRHCLDGC